MPGRDHLSKSYNQSLYSHTIQTAMLDWLEKRHFRKNSNAKGAMASLMLFQRSSTYEPFLDTSNIWSEIVERHFNENADEIVTTVGKWLSECDPGPPTASKVHHGHADTSFPSTHPSIWAPNVHHGDTSIASPSTFNSHWGALTTTTGQDHVLGGGSHVGASSGGIPHSLPPTHLDPKHKVLEMINKIFLAKNTIEKGDVPPDGAILSKMSGQGQVLGSGPSKNFGFDEKLLPYKTVTATGSAPTGPTGLPPKPAPPVSWYDPTTDYDMHESQIYDEIKKTKTGLGVYLELTKDVDANLENFPEVGRQRKTLGGEYFPAAAADVDGNALVQMLRGYLKELKSRGGRQMTVD